MAQEPKKKHSKARKRTRRSVITLSEVRLVECKNCHSLNPAHLVCKSCGFYQGEKVTDNLKVKVTKA